MVKKTTWNCEMSYICIITYGVASQKMVIFIVTGVKTLNLKKKLMKRVLISSVRDETYFKLIWFSGLSPFQLSSILQTTWVYRLSDQFTCIHMLKKFSRFMVFYSKTSGTCPTNFSFISFNSIPHNSPWSILYYTIILTRVDEKLKWLLCNFLNYPIHYFYWAQISAQFPVLKHLKYLFSSQSEIFRTHRKQRVKFNTSYLCPLIIYKG